MKTRTILISGISLLASVGIGYYFYKRRNTENREENKQMFLLKSQNPICEDIYINTKGEIIKRELNNLANDNFYIFLTHKTFIPIGLESDLGYLARAVLSEAGGATTNGKTISFKAKLAVAEVIKNRKIDNTPNSAKYKYLRYFSKYNTYKSVILNTGFDGIKKSEFLTPFKHYKEFGFRDEFIKCFQSAVFVYYNEINLTQNSFFFYTPSRVTKPRSWSFLYEVNVLGVEPYFEFSFLKFTE